MAKSVVHILEDGTIQKCHRFRSLLGACTRTPHWETVESAAIFLDNQAYLAERAAAVNNFTETELHFHHPLRLNTSFPTDKWSKKTVRMFGAQMDAYVASHGNLPLHLYGTMSSLVNKASSRYQTTVQVKTVMDKETLQTSRRWSVVAKIVKRSRDDFIYRDVDLDFSDYRATTASLKALREVFECSFEISTRATGWEAPGPRFTAELDVLMGRFADMYNAVEGAMRRPMDAQGDEIGDFTNSTEDKIVVDVEYDRSLFGARSFNSFFRENLYYNRPATVDAEIRVTDRRTDSDGETLWSLYRKDGIWSVVAVTSEGVHTDNLTPTAEDVRSHVYWHVIREINPGDQEQAFAKSEYAANLFTEVETELALHKAGAPQPL